MEITTLRIIKSETAEKHGWGSTKWRSVTHLTKEERQAVREKTALVYFRFTPWNHMQSGIKIVTGGTRGGFDSREPSIDEKTQIEAFEAVK